MLCVHVWGETLHNGTSLFHIPPSICEARAETSRHSTKLSRAALLHRVEMRSGSITYT